MIQTIQRITAKRSCIIGIDGLGGAGKTSYAQHLADQLQTPFVFSIDDFIHPRAIRYSKRVDEWKSYYIDQWRYDELIEKLLKPLQNGDAVQTIIELYVKEKDGYREVNYSIPRHSIVIVEGVFLQREELKPFWDYVVYIEVPEHIRLARVLKRDTYIGNREQIEKKYENRYFPAERFYIEKIEPAIQANKIFTHKNT